MSSVNRVLKKHREAHKTADAEETSAATQPREPRTQPTKLDTYDPEKEKMY